MPKAPKKTVPPAQVGDAPAAPAPSSPVDDTLTARPEDAQREDASLAPAGEQDGAEELPLPDPTPWRGVLDEAGLLVYIDRTGKMDGVPLPENCDLKVGLYRHKNGQFWPVERFARVASGETEKDTVLALTMMIMAQLEGRPVPQYALDWLEAYKRTPAGLELVRELRGRS